MAQSFRTSRRALMQASAGFSVSALLLRQGSGKGSLDQIAYAGSATQPGNAQMPQAKGKPGLKSFAPLEYSSKDEVSLAKGFSYHVLASMGDTINARNETFGDCADFTKFVPGSSDNQAFLWVNHEYINEATLYGRKIAHKEKSKKNIEDERLLLGGSYLELFREKQTKQFKVKSDSQLAFRLNGTTEIPLVGYAGGRVALGTMGNCSGGSTPWETILSAEENVADYYDKSDEASYVGWADHFEMNPNDYGYIVEVFPAQKTARKLTSLGKFAHEGCRVHIAKDKKIVAYMGDDARGECLYKFVSRGTYTGNRETDKDLLLEGTLYVADLQKCEWVALVPENKKLAADSAQRFKDQAAICVHTREAAKVAGGTPLNRPEGIDIDPLSGAVVVALTNNSRAGDFHGSILVLREEDGLHSGTRFAFDTLLTGGLRAGLSCPDNLVYGPGNYLWVGTDMSGFSMGIGAHKNFARNGFFRIETDSSGNAYSRLFLLAPYDAEVTGPCFTPNGDTLFLSIQHPGECSYADGRGLTSSWPKGAGSVPLSSVIAVVPNGANF